MNARPGNKVYGIITEKVLEALRNGTVPWRRPWKLGNGACNLISKQPYRGANAFLLAMDDRFTSKWWLTAKQAKTKGGYVRKGEHGTMVVFWKVGDKKKDGQIVRNPKTGKPEKSFILRYYLIFNIEQCEGIEEPKPEVTTPIDPIEACEAIVDGWDDKPNVVEKGDRAFYRERDDFLGMPPKESFESAPEWYSTLFHEFGHATGHRDRLNRDLDNDKGTGSYAREELIAEMCAAFLCGRAGIECKTIDNSSAYIASWLQRLANDPKLVIQAASKAQKAAEYILGAEADSKTDNTEESTEEAAATVVAA